MKRSKFTAMAVALLAPVALLASLAVATGSASAGDKCIDYDVQYTNGLRDMGTFCGGNTVTRADVPALHAMELHISCSDDLSNPSKSDLNGLTVATWSISKDGGSKVCGTSYSGGTDDKDAAKAAEKAAKEAEKAAKEAEKAAEKAAKEAEKAAEKAAKEAEKAAEKAAKEAEKAEKDKKSDKCITYDFLYESGNRDMGEFCGGNTVTRDDVPGLFAKELHISCSDDFSDPANPNKSDLDGEVVKQFSIVKSDGKSCGSPIDVPPSYSITFDCTSVAVQSNVPMHDVEVALVDGEVLLFDAGGATQFTIPLDVAADSITIDDVVSFNPSAQSCGGGS